MNDKVRCILLVDVDGVVIRPPAGSSWQDGLITDLGIDLGDLQRKFFDPCWKAIVTGRLDLYDAIGPALKRLGSGVSAETFVRYWFEHDAQLDEDLLEMLAAIRTDGHALHLVTNQEHHRARYLRESLGLSQYFETIHYSAAIGCTKPDARFFEHVARAVPDFPTMTPLLVDDQSANVRAAQNGGWNAMLWKGTLACRDRLRQAVAGLAGRRQCYTDRTRPF